MSVPWFQGLGKKELTLTIDRVSHEEVTSPTGKKSEMVVIRFKGCTGKRDKGLALNSKNHRRIARKVESYSSDDWIGLEVTLHLEEDRLFGGGRGPTLKVKVDATEGRK
jgi:hypothetical protein